MDIKWNKLRLAIGFLILAIAGTALTACNTVEGVGQDIESAGEAMEDAAKD